LALLSIIIEFTRGLDMDFVGIDSVVFGADDLPRARRSLQDRGFTKVTSAKAGMIYATGNGAQVIVRKAAGKGLPPRPRGGSQFREFVLGLRAQRELAAAKAVDAARARDAATEGTGMSPA
jgi:hypothetical protein